MKKGVSECQALWEAFINAEALLRDQCRLMRSQVRSAETARLAHNAESRRDIWARAHVSFNRASTGSILPQRRLAQSMQQQHENREPHERGDRDERERELSRRDVNHQRDEVARGQAPFARRNVGR